MQTTYQVRFWIRIVCTLILLLCGLSYAMAVGVTFRNPVGVWEMFDHFDRTVNLIIMFQIAALIAVIVEWIIPFREIQGKTSSWTIKRSKEGSTSVVNVDLQVRQSESSPSRASGRVMDLALLGVHMVFTIVVFAGVWYALVYFQVHHFEPVVPEHTYRLVHTLVSCEVNFCASLFLMCGSFLRAQRMLEEHGALFGDD